ncbi:type II toxin-antitoxin system VapC family toxin [Breznakiellaceae bacterium SP9]
MGGYLLDTHAAIWFFNGDNALSDTALRIIRNGSNPVYLSVVSAWELAIKISLGKLRFSGGSALFLGLAEANNITIVPIASAHLTALEGLPWIHRDPFDRLLIATALSEQMVLITADGNIAQYDAPQVW